MESGRDALLERIAELLDAAASGAPTFCTPLTPRAVAGSHGGPCRACVPAGAPPGFIDTGATNGVVCPLAPAPPLLGAGTSTATYGPDGMQPYHPRGGTLGRATWSVGHYGEVFEAAAPEAYLPRMVDQEYMLEDDPGSFLELGWEEEALEAGTFREPSGSLTNRTGDNDYKVPLIP